MCKSWWIMLTALGLPYQRSITNCFVSLSQIHKYDMLLYAGGVLFNLFVRWQDRRRPESASQACSTVIEVTCFVVLVVLVCLFFFTWLCICVPLFVWALVYIHFFNVVSFDACVLIITYPH